MKSILAALFAGVVACLICQPPAAAEAGKAKERVLYSFCARQNCMDGAIPYSNLVSMNGTLYGTTSIGGQWGSCFYSTIACGTVFAVDPNSGKEKVVYSFCLLTACEDGRIPYAGLIAGKGILCGTTFLSNTWGTVFSVSPDSGREKVLHAFPSADGDGEEPNAGLTDVKGTLYGTTSGGGAGSCQSGCGTVFSVDAKTGTEVVLHSFAAGTDGQYPNAGLIAANGILYGTTNGGGAYGDYGTVFSVDPNTGAETVLHSFGNGTDGQIPRASLINVKGMLYGTSEFGGGAGTCSDYSPGCGTVFVIDPKTGAEKVLHAFGNGLDGQQPYANLTDVKGALYGTTVLGGRGDKGTVYVINPDTGTEKVIYSFCSLRNCADGAAPVTGLLEIDGTLYGTTTDGGNEGCYVSRCGTVFALTLK